MNITWLTMRHPPDVGGMACSSGRLVNGLRDRGHSVFVVHLTNDPVAVWDTARKEAAGNCLFDNWNREVTSGINAPIEPERIFWTFRKQMADSVLVGFGGDLPGYLATLWGKWLSLKSVVLFRGNDFERVIHDGKRAWLTHFVLQQADVVGAVSREMAARIAMFRPQGRTIYTPNSIDPTEWAFLPIDLRRAAEWRNVHLADGRPVIAMIGQLKTKKGLELAAQVLASPPFAQNVHFLTVGDIPQDDTPTPPNWMRVPFQSRERLPMFYAVADIILIPSLYDGMPNVLLEAMALGKVVVASRAGGIPDVIADGENGLLFDVNDVTSMTNALHAALATSAEQRREMGTRARTTIETQYAPACEIAHLERAFA